MKSSIISKGNLLLALAFFIAIALWSLTPWIICRITPDYSERGQIGDLFGSVNALFSGLGFAALLYTLKAQRDELTEAQKSRKAEIYFGFMRNEPLFVVTDTFNATEIKVRLINYGQQAYNAHLKVLSISAIKEREVIIEQQILIFNNKPIDFRVSALLVEGTNYLLCIRYTNYMNQLNNIALLYDPFIENRTPKVIEIHNQFVDEFELNDLHDKLKCIPESFRKKMNGLREKGSFNINL
jgi:hypothetical protein